MPPIVVAIRPVRDKDAPPPLSPPDDPNPVQLGGGDKDRSTQFCDNCKYYCLKGYCMMYPEWQQHDPKDWCGQWEGGEPRDLDADVEKAKASNPAQQAPQGPPQGGPPSTPPGGKPFGQ